MILREKDKQQLIQLFSRIENPVEVLAYGSRVNNTAHEASDLDLVIRSKNGEPISKNVYADLQEQIKQSNIPILVELREWTTLPKSFHRQIEKIRTNLFNLNIQKQITNVQTPCFASQQKNTQFDNGACPIVL
jgi:uncharacterized protein